MDPAPINEAWAAILTLVVIIAVIAGIISALSDGAYMVRDNVKRKIAERDPIVTIEIPAKGQLPEGLSQAIGRCKVIELKVLGDVQRIRAHAPSDVLGHLQKYIV